MTTLLVIALVIVALIFILRRWNPALVLVTNAKLPKVSATVDHDSGSLRCNLLLEQAAAPHFVTSLDTSRAEADALGLGTPEGFHAEPMPSAPSDDKAWVDEWNSNNLRFVGRLELQPSVPVTLIFPLSGAQDGPITIKGQFGNGRKFGGSISFFRIVHKPLSDHAQ